MSKPLVGPLVGTVYGQRGGYQVVEVKAIDNGGPVPLHLQFHYLSRQQRANDAHMGDKVLLEYRTFGSGGLWFASLIKR